MTGGMEYVHRCPFCAWHRDATVEAMLEPRCQRCGGTLQALTREAYDREQARAARERARLRPKVLGQGARRALTGARWVVTAVIAVAVAHAAYGAGGAGIAAGAFAIAALFSLNVLFPGR